MSNEPEALSTLAGKVADGSEIDWELEASCHRRSESSVRGLEIVHSILEFHRGPTELTSEATDALGGPADPGEALPDRWGSLEIRALLGRGACAEVVRAYDPVLQREVALKLPHTRDEIRSRAFLNEARRLARVHHPNVLEVHGAEKHQGRVGMWSELLEGRHLEDCLRSQGPFSANETALIGVDLCRALAAIHRAGLLHRDIKASNVMREEGGRIVLMDFSSVVEGGREELASGDCTSTYGSPYYMAPELLDGDEATVSSDLYALGVLLYRLASGRYPVEAEDVPGLIARHRESGFVPLLDLRPELPAAFAQVIEGALDPRPERRYSSAGEMERALRAACAPAVPAPDPRPRLRRVASLATAAALVLLAMWMSARLAGPRPLSVEAALYRRGAAVDERLKPGTPMRLGEELFLEVEGSRPFHAYVLNEDAAGTQNVLFPLPSLALENPLPDRVRHRLPGLAAPDGEKPGRLEKFWLLDSAGGEETVLLVASIHPLPELEATIETLIRGDPADSAALGPGDALRGIGGLTTHPVSAGGPVPGSSLADLWRRLLAEQSDEVRVWQIRLGSPPAASTAPAGD